MSMTVWTVTSDTDDGIRTTAHGAEIEAYKELKARYCNTTAEEATFDQHITAGTYAELLEWVSGQTEGTGDSFSVTSHSITPHSVEDAQPTSDPRLDEAFREAATSEYAEEGRIEIDSNAVMSYGEDDGAYVAAWVWVDRSDVPVCPCGERNDDGEGFDGLCGTCADKVENNTSDE